MSQKNRHLLTMAVAVAVLTFIYTGLTMFAEDLDEKEAVYEQIISIDEDDLSSIAVDSRSEEAFTMQIASDDEGTEYTMSGDTELEYSQTLMQELMNTARDLSARPVEQDCTDLTKYGLAGEAQTDVITITKTDESTVTLTLGLITESFGTYCVLDDSDDVYLIDNDTAEVLRNSQTYYRNLSILGGYYSLSDELQTLTVDSMADGTTVAIAARDTSALTEDEAEAYSEFIFTAPLACDADDSELSTGILSDLQDASTAQSIAEDYPADLSQYGLDTPVRIHLTANNLDETLLIGDETDDGGIYVMLDGGTTVFICTASSFDFLEEDWNDWRSTNLLPCALTQVDSITVQQGDTTHVVDVTLVEADENDESDTDTCTATLDGNDMTDDALEQFFLAITSVNYTRLVDDPQNGEAEAVVTVKLTDGTTRTLSFIKGGSREYLAAVDGGSYAYGIQQDDLNSILSNLKTGADDADASAEE